MTGLTLVLIVSGAALWASVLYVVPRHVESLFRYDLWRLRDDLVDNIFDETLPNLPLVEGLLEAIEAMIGHSSQVTLSSLLAFLISRRSNRSSHHEIDLSSLSESQQLIFLRVLHETYDAAAFKSVAGSPFGAFGLPIIIVARLIGRIGPPRPERELRRLLDFRKSVQTNHPVGNLAANVG
jgi:hypothetical protein